MEAVLSEVDYDREGIVDVYSKAVVDASDWKLQNPQQVYLPPASNPAEQDGIAWFRAAENLTPSAFAFSTMPRTPPDVSLAVEWVYGYSAEKCKNNLRYTSVGNIAYHVGPYAVLYDFDAHKQRVFSGHNEEVLSLCLHPVRKEMAPFHPPSCI
jgi:hypothetical protein